MTKTVKILNLDCPNCAARIEKGIMKIDGVNSVSIAFLPQKMTLDYDETNPEIVGKILAVCKKVEDDCEVVGL